MAFKTNGYIKLYRNILQSPVYSDLNVRVIFIHLLLIAQYERGYSIYSITLLAGQVVTTVKQLADETGLTPQQVRTALKKLEFLNVIAMRTTNKFTQISILNWEKWQDREGCESLVDYDKKKYIRRAAQTFDNIHKGKD